MIDKKFTPEEIASELTFAREYNVEGESRLVRTQWVGRVPDEWEVRLGKYIENRRNLIAIIEQLQERAEKSLEFAFRYGQIDGDHHRLWVIDQMVRALTDDGYDTWVHGRKYGVEGEELEEDESYDWEVGIPP